MYRQSSKYKKIQDYVIGEMCQKNPELAKELLNYCDQIYLKFGSKTKFINYFEKLSLEDLIELKKEYKNEWYEKSMLHLLLAPIEGIKVKNGNKVYRILKDHISEMEGEGCLFSNPVASAMRFNQEDERMLYVSTNEFVCAHEIKVPNHEVTLVEYDVVGDINLNVFGYYHLKQMRPSNSLSALSSKKYKDLINSKQSKKYSTKEYDEMKNLIKKFFTSNNEIDGYGKKYHFPILNVKKDVHFTIGIKEDAEVEKLVPSKLKTVKYHKVNGQYHMTIIKEHSITDLKVV